MGKKRVFITTVLTLLLLGALHNFWMKPQPIVFGFEVYGTGVIDFQVFYRYGKKDFSEKR